MAKLVSTIRTRSYEEKEMTRAVQAHFHQLEIGPLLHPGMQITIKPNLLMKRTPEEGTTTHPALVRAVVEKLLEHDIPAENITIADSPGGPYTKGQLEGIYQATGMAEVAKQTGVRLNLETGWQVRRGGEDCICREWNIIDPVANADFVVNLPKLKTHAMTVLSGGMKNLFGCVPGLQKPQLHFRFSDKALFGRMLMDLARLIRPGLTIVDAVVAMEGDGPSAGQLRHTGMTFAARDVFVLDRSLCDFVGLDPQSVPMVKAAMDEELCPVSTEEIVYLGDGRPAPEEDYRMPSSKSLDFTARFPRWLHRPARFLERRLLTPWPVVRRSECIGCGKCAESCAPQAAVIRERKAYIDYDKCITCYCCHEMCPVKAIGIKSTWFGK